jgi:hypothetical protein
MRNLLKYIFLLVTVSFTALTGFSCSCSCDKNAPPVEIPANILEKANAYIKGKVTEDFFNKYITLDPWRTKSNISSYYFLYRFIIPRKPFINGLMEFSTDTLGKVRKNSPYGIPDIKSDPAKGIFNIDRAAAEQIARKAGLAPGLKKWQINFVWYKKLNLYAWSVRTTLEIIDDNFSVQAKGNEILIDPNTGKILESANWWDFK